MLFLTSNLSLTNNFTPTSMRHICQDHLYRMKTQANWRFTPLVKRRGDPPTCISPTGPVVRYPSMEMIIALLLLLCAGCRLLQGTVWVSSGTNQALGVPHTGELLYRNLLSQSVLCPWPIRLQLEKRSQENSQLVRSETMLKANFRVFMRRFNLFFFVHHSDILWSTENCISKLILSWIEGRYLKVSKSSPDSI